MLLLIEPPIRSLADQSAAGAGSLPAYSNRTTTMKALVNHEPGEKSAEPPAKTPQHTGLRSRARSPIRTKPSNRCPWRTFRQGWALLVNTNGVCARWIATRTFK